MIALLTFAGTHDAIAAETSLRQAQIAVSIMPIPSAITVGCGLALRVAWNERQAALDAIAAASITVEAMFRAVPREPHGYDYERIQ